MCHQPGQQEIGVNCLPIKFEFIHALNLGGNGNRHRISDQAVKGSPIGRLDRLPAVESIQIDIQDVRLRLEVIDADTP